MSTAIVARAKRLVETGVVRSGIPRLLIGQRKGQRLILAYHDIVAELAPSRGDASLHLPLSSFRAQLDEICRRFDVVVLDTISEAASSHARPRIAITFDDAYEGVLEHALPELKQRGLPATVFVAPALLGLTPWWDILAEPLTGAVPVHIRDRAMKELGGMRDKVLATFTGQPQSALPRIASETDLVRAASDAGDLLRFGSHSWSHAHLPSLDDAILSRELSAPLSWLRERFENVSRFLSYPYGAMSAKTEDYARGAGYTGSLRVEGGWQAAGDHRTYGMPRLNVPAGVSSAGFHLRLAGLVT